MLNGEKMSEVVGTLHVAVRKLRDAYNKLGRRPEIDAIDDLVEVFIRVGAVIEDLRDSQNLSYLQIFSRSPHLPNLLPFMRSLTSTDLEGFQRGDD